MTYLGAVIITAKGEPIGTTGMMSLQLFDPAGNALPIPSEI